MRLSWSRAPVLLGMSPKESFQLQRHSQMFTDTVFTITGTCKRLISPSTDKCMNEDVVLICNANYKRRNNYEIPSKRMNLENIRLNEITKTQKG